MADRPQADKWAQQITTDYNPTTFYHNLQHLTYYNRLQPTTYNLQIITKKCNLQLITSNFNLQPIESITYAYTIQITLTKTYTVGPTAYNLLPNQNLM